MCQSDWPQMPRLNIISGVSALASSHPLRVKWDKRRRKEGCTPFSCIPDRLGCVGSSSHALRLGQTPSATWNYPHTQLCTGLSGSSACWQQITELQSLRNHINQFLIISHSPYEYIFVIFLWRTLILLAYLKHKKVGILTNELFEYLLPQKKIIGLLKKKDNGTSVDMPHPLCPTFQESTEAQGQLFLYFKWENRNLPIQFLSKKGKIVLTVRGGKKEKLEGLQ